jgi:hypothetical protein
LGRFILYIENVQSYGKTLPRLLPLSNGFGNPVVYQNISFSSDSSYLTYSIPEI